MTTVIVSDRVAGNRATVHDLSKQLADLTGTQANNNNNNNNNSPFYMNFDSQ